MLFLGVGLAFYLAGRHAGPSAAARVGFADDDVDLGTHPWASDVPVTLYFENRTTEPVTISHIVSTCGCMLVHGASGLKGKVVEPNASVPIEVSLNTGRRAKPTSAHLQLQTDDGKRYQARLHTLVVGEWTLSADVVDFGDVALHGPAAPTQGVVFSSTEDELLDAPACRAPWLKCTAVPRSGEVQNTVDITLRVEPDKLPPGLNTTGVKLATTNPTVPNAWITVRARGVTLLTAYPPQVLLSRGRTATVRFLDAEHKLPRILSVEAPASVGTRVLGVGIIELSIGDALALDTPVRVEVRDELGRIGTVLVSPIRSGHFKGAGS